MLYICVCIMYIIDKKKRYSNVAVGFIEQDMQIIIKTDLFLRACKYLPLAMLLDLNLLFKGIKLQHDQLHPLTHANSNFKI
jgi:hypothetical protein